MKLDNIVLVICAVLAAFVVLGYGTALLIGVVHTGGLLLPVLIGFLVVLGIFAMVVRQRLNNAEDDHYENIER